GAASPAPVDDVKQSALLKKYCEQLRDSAMNVWVMPVAAKPGLKVVLKLHIEKSGHISDIKVAQPSGDADFDSSAVAAAKKLKLSPLPAIAGDSYDVPIEFDTVQ
ncbi:MAG TPA: energy transducer TonB, partial [Chthoniobacteraceae bacterium]|nr:energy transducer TonB [Chthoniobacteraceae bacterium]